LASPFQKVIPLLTNATRTFQRPPTAPQFDLYSFLAHSEDTYPTGVQKNSTVCTTVYFTYSTYQKRLLVIYNITLPPILLILFLQPCPVVRRLGPPRSALSSAQASPPPAGRAAGRNNHHHPPLLPSPSLPRQIPSSSGASTPSLPHHPVVVIFLYATIVAVIPSPLNRARP